MHPRGVSLVHFYIHISLMTALQNMIGTTSLNLRAEKLIEGIQNNDESFHREEFVWLTEWWGENKVDLNVTKMKEIIPDLKANSRKHIPISVNGAGVKKVVFSHY